MIDSIISLGNFIKELKLLSGYVETDTYAILERMHNSIPNKKIISIGKCQDELPDLLLPQGTIIDQNEIAKFANFVSERAELCTSQYSLKFRTQIKTFDWVTYYDIEGQWEYLMNLRKSKYCLSPHGSKPDCFRHWEAMYMGCIPITLKSPWLEGFYDMPILFLDSWDDLTPELLVDKYDELNNRSREKLDINYWLNKVKEITNE